MRSPLLVPIKHYPTINWNDSVTIRLNSLNLFQLNTIQRLTETALIRLNTQSHLVPIKHYPTINWNRFQSLPYESSGLVPIKHYPTINWNVEIVNRTQSWEVVPIKHYPTINWNLYKALLVDAENIRFQLNTIQRLTETYLMLLLICRLRFQLNTIQRLTETRDGRRDGRQEYRVPIKHYPTINWNLPEP